MIPDDATRAQIEAARPDASTWLGANAGSGKTRVLTDRVARLLLNEVNPQHILCLTYTKAAASEMQNRLFKRLGHWAMLDDDALRQELAQLGVEGALTQERLSKARTLFALAIETPGGLKIQTIHSFCAALLRRFPLEAGVSPQFTEIEDRAAELLRAEILDQMAEDDDAPLIADLAGFFTGEDFGRLTQIIVQMRDAFVQDQTRQDLFALFNQPSDLSAAKITASVFVGDEESLISDLVPLLLERGGNDAKSGRVLAQITRMDETALPLLEQVLLTGSGAKAPFTAKIGSFPTKATRQILGPALADLEALMQRVEDARDARLALEAVDKTHTLHRFARAFLTRYETAKQQRGWLDFDDLILRARALLQDSAVAAWVLYRIDGGIEHILVDEAQDTSPRQWDVIEKLTDEFYTGEGARDRNTRTLFVVGDKKQSIYSFQGADPAEFDRKANVFEDKVNAAGETFQRRSLDYSFRSSNAILRFVDTVFDPRRRPGFDDNIQHLAFKDALPGRVDLWPVVPVAETEEDRPWTDPLDRRSPHHHTVILAEQIACKIKNMIDARNPALIPDDTDGPEGMHLRPVRAGDFLILVQRRSALFSEIIRACKAAHLPIAGADRLKVGAELAVKDLGALLSWLATPDDNLSLATALKSPLFGWSEQDLFDLAHRRDTPILWEALRTKSTHHPDTLHVLHDLRSQVDFLRPFDLIERVLTRHEGRKNLLARLGAEAEDGINAMLTQALAYERNDIPSLTGFIEWMQTDDLEIKRQIDSASDQIRVMTVHGAKGLEAPIVILPDTGKRDVVIRDDILTLDDVPVWKPAREAMPAALAARVEEMKEAQQAERLRLLYVAMTRAEKWLMIAAAGKVSQDGDAWYHIAQEAMGHVNGVPLEGDGTIRFQQGNWDDLKTTNATAEPAKEPVLDTVFTTPCPLFCHPSDVLSPSDLGGVKALPGEEGETAEVAMAYGSLVHSFLEQHAGSPASLLADGVADMRMLSAPHLATQAAKEAKAVLEAAHLQAIFAPGTLAEIPITASVGGSRLHGVVDRLILSDTEVLVVDYKTNRHVPSAPDKVPEGILRQMGAYAAMLAQIYPDHRVKTAILWTATATLMRLPNDIVTRALERSPYLDDAHGHS